MNPKQPQVPNPNVPVPPSNFQAPPPKKQRGGGLLKSRWFILGIVAFFIFLVILVIVAITSDDGDFSEIETPNGSVQLLPVNEFINVAGIEQEGNTLTITVNLSEPATGACDVRIAINEVDFTKGYASQASVEDSDTCVATIDFADEDRGRFWDVTSTYNSSDLLITYNTDAAVEYMIQ